MIAAANTDFLHPTAFEKIGGASDRRGTTAQNAIDGGIGDCGTGSSFWAFISPLGGGADFSFQFNTTIQTTSITVSSCSTGDKSFVVKNRNGGYDVVYSLGNTGSNTQASGTLNGNFIQQDGKIVIGVRNARQEAEHFLNDIAFKIEYAPANLPPSAPELLFPSFNQTFDSQIAFSWNPSQDPENDPLNYSLQYSSDGVSWNDIATADCCEYVWNSEGLQEGIFFVSIRAFDGRQHSERSQAQVNIRHVFYSQASQENAFVGIPVEWRVSVHGNGERNCAYAVHQDFLQARILDFQNNELPFQNDSNRIFWNCDLSQGNQTVIFSTPEVISSGYGWVQDGEKQSTAETQFLKQTQGVKNPSQNGYSGVYGDFQCIGRFSCRPSNFVLEFLNSGAEVNYTIEAGGDGIFESETEDKGEYYNKTVSLENSLFELQNLSVKTTVPLGLQFELLVKRQGEFENAAEGFSFSTEQTAATVFLPALSVGITEFRLSAKRKNQGEACFENAECVSDYCFEGSCSEKENQTLFKPTPTAPAQNEFYDSEGMAETNASSQPPLNPLEPSEKKAPPEGRGLKTTALVVKKTDYPLYILAILAASALLGYHAFFRKRVRVSQKNYGGRVSIAVKNSLADLKNIKVLQLVPENSAGNFSLQPKARQTVTGDLLEWDFEYLAKGRGVSLEFELAGEGMLTPVQIQAETPDGRVRSFHS